MPTNFLMPTSLHNLLDYQLFLGYRLSMAYTEARCRAELGVGGRHWRILATVAENAGATLRDISQAADLDMAQTSRAVGQLVRKGLVRRSANPSNRRLAFIALTAQGEETHRAMQNRLAMLNAEILSVLDGDQIREFAASLDKIHEKSRALIAEAGHNFPSYPTVGDQ